MADGKEVAVVETSTANPKQAVNVIDNIENVSAFNTPTQTLQENPAIFKQQENNSFFNSDAWNTFKSNPMRAFEPKYPGFAAIESVASNPVYTSTVDRYGEAVANRAQVLHSTYAKATNPFSRFAEAYNTHRYGLRAAAARKELSDAIRDGDEAKVSTAKLKYQSERRKSYEEGYGYEEYGDTLMSVLASMARNPETIAIEIGGALTAPFTGGASMLAANAINAGIVGMDTYKVEAGGALEQLDEISPELSEEQKMSHARNVGWLNAAVEAGMFGIGGNVLGRGVKGIGTEAAIKSTVRAVKKETGKEITRDAAKELLKVRFLKALQNPAKEKTFKDTLKEVTKNVGWGALGEGSQEVFQNSVTESMLRSVKNGTTLTEEMLDDWVDFVSDPFSEAHADKWETFVNVSLASLIPGAGFQGAAGAIRGYKGTRGQDELNDVQSKLLGARNNSLGLSQLFSWHKNAGSKEAIGVSNAVLEDQIKRGEVSGKLYTTAEQVAEMQKDPEVAAALEEIGIAKALEQAAENGGVVELDLVAYDKVVNESQNTALFQKMRNYLSFSDTTMSLNEFNQFINSKGKQLASLITDEIRNDQESVYNKLKAMALKAGRPEERAEGYAVLGHLILTNMEGLVKGQKNDILDRLTLKVSTDNETLVERFNKEKAIAPSLDLPAANWEELTTYENGKLKDSVWQQIRSLFTEEQLKKEHQGPGGIAKTFEELLYNSVDAPGRAARPYSKAEIESVANTFGVEPEQVSNIIRLARGMPVAVRQTRESNSADVDIAGMVDAVFTEKEESNSRTYHMFVGEKADTSALPQAFQDRIQKAKDMMAQGKSDKEVFEETRLHIAPDGKLRIQISDKDAQLTEDSGKFLRQYKDKYGKPRYRKEQCKLGDIFEHELLFDLYPALKDLPVYISGTSTYAMSRYINLSTTETPSRIRQSILHEVQHIVQKYEGFARGGASSHPKTTNEDFAKRNTLIHKVVPKLVENKVITYWSASEGGDSSSSMYNRLGSPDEMRALIDSPAVKKIAAKDEEFAKNIEEIRALNNKLEGLDNRLAAIKYFRLFGEAESRLTERLSYKTQEELDKLDPYGYFDVSKFIVKSQDNVVIAKVEAPKNTQDTGEFNVVFDAETGRSIVDGTLVVAGKTIEQNGRYTIQLEPEANAVTFAHELFHVLSLEIQRVYNEGTITEYWKKQAEKMFKIAGAEAQVDETDPTVERYYLTEAQEEHLANMFTTYIMKGKIQNREVRGLLAKLIDIFKATYQQLEGAGLTPMALDKKVNEFFDAVVSSQNTIEEIQRDAGLLEILPPEGVDRELYDYYIDNLTTSKIEASNDLRRKWFAIDGFKKSAEYTKLMQRLKEEAKAELLEDDRYKIIAQASLFEGSDKAEQVFIWAQNNMPEANYTLGDITDILENTPSLEEASTKAAEQEMEAYIVKKFRITPQDLGFKEERNRAKVRALLAESVMRRGGTLADMETEIKKAEAASDKHIANISVYQIIDLNKWKNREAAIVERYAWARQQDNKDLMSAERYNQAVVNLIMIKANGYKSEYQKLNALFEKLQSKQKKYQRKDEHGKPYGPYEHRYHAEDWELLRSISEKFGNNIRDGRRSVKNVHEQLVDWIKTQVENRFTTVAGLEDFLPFINKGHDGKIGSMKGKNFKKLWAVMHTIDSIAMREQQLYLDGQYQQLGEFVDETVKFHREKQIKTDEDKDSWYNKFFGRYGTWQNPEPLLKAIFPPKVFQKIFLPMFEGALKSEYVAKRWIKEWNDAKAKINTSNEAFVLDDGSQITYGETVKKTMTYGDVANLLIAMGAEHSYENYRLKFGLSEEQVQMIASQAIKRNAAYVDFMNTTWKVYGEATEALNDSFQERTNELFVRKEHRAFEVDGIKFEGGYVPEDKHYVALVRELGTWNQGLKNKKENKNEKLLAKAADGDILSIIDITETKLSQSAKWAYAAVPYNNVKKFIEQRAVSDTIGDRAFNFIKDWLQGWDTPHFDESGIWRPLTRVTTVAALGARASTVLLQLSGIMQAMTYLGPTYLARGMLQFVRENGFFHPFKTPKGKSIYMETRVEDPFSARFGTESQGRSFNDILNSYNAKSKVGKAALGVVSAYQTAAMVSIQIVDGWVSTITWNGAYARALDKGMTEAEARAEADSAVRTTQSDATQISRSAAMQEPWARAVTAFSTWIMAMRSQVVALSTSKSYRKDMAMWIASYAVMSSFIEAFLKEVTEPADEGEEDKEMLERIFNSWYNKIVEAVGSQAMPFAGFGSAAAKIAAAALVNTDDEKIFNVYAGGNVAALQYGWRVAQAGGQALKYLRTGEDEDLEKLGIQATGLVSYGLKKRVKKALED